MHSLISDNLLAEKLRNKVADICLDYGLERLLISAFLGEINHHRREELLPHNHL
jgi:CRISPR-associated protein Cas2